MIPFTGMISSSNMNIMIVSNRMDRLVNTWITVIRIAVHYGMLQVTLRPVITKPARKREAHSLQHTGAERIIRKQLMPGASR